MDRAHLPHLDADGTRAAAIRQLITTDGHQRVVAAHKFAAEGRDGGPTKDDLVAAVVSWLEQHPSHNRTVVEQLLADAGHRVVYTPPFCPDVQPIELLWAKVKRFVADRSTLNRSVTQAREDTEAGFESVTKMFCNNVVKHAHDWIDKFIRTEAAEDLQQCGSLAGVVKHLPLIRVADNSSPSMSSSPAHSSPPASPAAAAAAPSAARSLRRRD